MKRHIPNLITSLNLASGFIAVIYASKGELNIASWFIIAAMIFDFCDGFSARLLNSYSPLGKELDSLADVVSFGVAPGIIICSLLISADPGNARAAMLVSAIMPVFASLRLAKFNIDTEQATVFRGLPTPANAIAVISVILGGEKLSSLTGSFAVLTVLTIVLSGLMVSRIPLLSLKMKNIGFKGNEARYIMVIMLATAFAIFGTTAIPFVIPVYIAASLLALLF